MRRNNRLNIPVPSELTSIACVQHHEVILNDPTADPDSDFYRGKRINADKSITYVVQEALRLLYKNKCAYCEKSAHKPKVDHHRPKGKILNMPRNTHGYFWLCYEWTNLLPACKDCNDVTNKGSKYPVLGNRNTTFLLSGIPPLVDRTSFVYDSPFNRLERPLLLHPEYCIPEEHFDFDLTGKILGISDEGNATIDTIHLDNDDLNGWRRSIYMGHMNSLLGLLRDYLTADNQFTPYIKKQITKWLMELVKESKNDDLEHTLFRKTMINKFQTFFIDPLEHELQPIIRNIFLEYIDSRV